MTEAVDRPFEWRWRILQDGYQVAGGVCHDKRFMLSEMSHYAELYSQEGTVTLETRTGKNKWRRHLP
ncbi:hypothetical protein [Sphingomonas baiyangensis]|uniref:Uncharacterized protein n=1 Tax=Sphingomonas baiyangensis TaxID=2572576 RepID=A0A4U1L202_9SPHN|nr:hypothetical protein [Sphingomonas baiyangensis]TKD50240.1 hypothetical protein FBR43_05315 [Sphingomonas baiyangensis]